MIPSITLVSGDGAFFFSSHPKELGMYTHMGGGIYSSNDLMDELVEAVLAICSRLSKVNLTCMEIKWPSIHGYTLSIAFHTDLHNSTFRSFPWPIDTEWETPGVLHSSAHALWSAGEEASNYSSFSKQHTYG